MDSSNALIPSENIYPSSLAPGVTNEDLRLNGPNAWTPSPNDTEPSVTVDLDKPSIVTGVIVQGGGPDTDDFVTLFTVEYSEDGENFFPITDTDDEPMVCRSSLFIVFKHQIYMLEVPPCDIFTTKKRTIATTKSPVVIMLRKIMFLKFRVKEITNLVDSAMHLEKRN